MTHFKNHAEPERNGSLLNLLMKSIPQVSNYLFSILGKITRFVSFFTMYLLTELDVKSKVNVLPTLENYFVCVQEQ